MKTLVAVGGAAFFAVGIVTLEARAAPTASRLPDLPSFAGSDVTPAHWRQLPNFARRSASIPAPPLHCQLSHGLAFAGRSDEAIKHGETAIRLSPVDPDMARFRGGFAIAHYTARRFEEALHYTRENVRLRPGFQGAQRLHAASLAQSGRIEEARAVLSTLRRTHRPPLTIAWVKENVPYQTPELVDLFVDGLRKAGLNV